MTVLQYYFKATGHACYISATSNAVLHVSKNAIQTAQNLSEYASLAHSDQKWLV